MMTWVLILFLGHVPATVIENYGSKMQCENAGKTAIETLCTPTQRSCKHYCIPGPAK